MVNQKRVGEWMNGWEGERVRQKSLLDGRMDGWVDGWMDGWMGGSQSRVKDCLQQSKMTHHSFLCKKLGSFSYFNFFSICFSYFAQ